VGRPDRPSIVASARHEANKNDNREKLLRAATDDRHLFVWISRVLPLLAFRDGPPPVASELPPWVTTLWAAGCAADMVYVWRATCGRGWESFIREERDFEPPETQ
jgi:hypothetical protein